MRFYDVNRMYKTLNCSWHSLGLKSLVWPCYYLECFKALVLSTLGEVRREVLARDSVSIITHFAL